MVDVVDHLRLEGTGDPSPVPQVGSFAEAARADLGQLVRHGCAWRDVGSE